MKKRINKRAYKMQLYCEKNHVDSELYNYIQDAFGKFGDSWVIWIMKLYGCGKWKEGDASETYDGIKGLYELYNDGIITSQMLDCERYDDVNTLIGFVLRNKDKQFDIKIELGFKDKKHIVHSQYRNDYDVFYYDNELLVINPLSYKGCRMWGYDTRWCTSSSNGNEIFQYYNKQGSIFIHIKLDGLLKIDKTLIKRIDFFDIVREHILDRFQLHFETEQCMDINDKAINIIYSGLNLGIIGEYKDYCLKQNDKLHGNKFCYWLRWFCKCEIDDVNNKITFINICDDSDKYIYDISECDFMITHYKEDYDWEYSEDSHSVNKCADKIRTIIIKNYSTNKFTYLSNDYKVLYPGKWWDFCDKFNDDIAIVSNYNDNNYNDKMSTYINNKGEYLFPGKYWKNVSPFHHNKAIVVIDNNKQTFINDKGEYLFPDKYWDECVITANNKLQVKQGGKYYFIDNVTGEIIDRCYL